MSTWWNEWSEKAHAKGVKEGRAESSRRIKDLEAEVKRLNSFIRDVAKTGGAAQEKALISVWNDAMEAAASVIVVGDVVTNTQRKVRALKRT